LPRSLTLGAAWVAATALDALYDEASRHYPNETGGLLLGWRHSPTEIVVTDVIGPGPGAEHSRCGFRPDATWQADVLAAKYAHSGRRFEYLGDWHTHPGGNPVMSRLDWRTLRVIARHADSRCPRPVMGIIADGDPWRLTIYQRLPNRRRRTAKPMSLRPFSLNR
jgi:integrative and conjugative element protein (TIGR02256 family)